MEGHSELGERTDRASAHEAAAAVNAVDNVGVCLRTVADRAPARSAILLKEHRMLELGSGISKLRDR